VAAQLILDGGIDAVTMEAVAAAAGVSKGLGYVYFENRNELLLAVLERELHANEVCVGHAVDAAATFEDKIRAAVKSWFDLVAERGALLGTLLTATQLEGDHEAQRRARRRQWEDYYAQLAAEHLGIPRRKAAVAAAILLAGLSGVLDRWTISRDPRWLLEETFVQVALGGLGALAE
jgi:AcrR family transcriptional regulator